MKEMADQRRLALLNERGKAGIFDAGHAADVQILFELEHHLGRTKIPARRLNADGQKRFLGSDWKLSSKSDRTGFRLDGPQWTFTAKATTKAPEHGSEPSNIIDQGYPVGAIILAGQTPIILVNDWPSRGGFINRPRRRFGSWDRQSRRSCCASKR